MLSAIILILSFLYSGIIQVTPFIATDRYLFLQQRTKRPTSTLHHLQKDSTKNDAILRFSATYKYTTSPILLHRQNETNHTTFSTLHNFFSIDKHRNCLLIGSNNLRVRKPTSLLQSKPRSLFDSCWNREALHFKAFGIEQSKNRNVDILELLIKTPFLVFSINSSTLVGVIMTKDGEKEEVFVDNKLHSPEYQFLLLAEDFEADGPPPLVWIFNQLTGRGRKERLEAELPNDPHTIHTYLRVWASDAKSYSGDIKADRIVFKASCRTEININFPSILLKILPVPKEVIEKQGNKVLMFSMERDLVPGVDEFREAFIKWKREHIDQ